MCLRVVPQRLPAGAKPLKLLKVVSSPDLPAALDLVVVAHCVSNQAHTL